MISRDRAGIYLDGAHAAEIFVNGQQVAALRAGHQVRVYPPLGETIVGVRFGKFTRQTSVILKPDTQSKVRVGFSDDQLMIEPSAF